MRAGGNKKQKQDQETWKRHLTEPRHRYAAGEAGRARRIHSSQVKQTNAMHATATG
jgi:hypothetical protein